MTLCLEKCQSIILQPWARFLDLRVFAAAHRQRIGDLLVPPRRPLRRHRHRRLLLRHRHFPHRLIFQFINTVEINSNLCHFKIGYNDLIA